MSTTCIHCGRDQQDDNELQAEIITDTADVTAIPVETLVGLRQTIETLNTIVDDKCLHDGRTKALTNQSFKILDILLE